MKEEITSEGEIMSPPRRSWVWKVSKYKILKKLISEWIEEEIIDFQEAKDIAGVDCAGACLASGAIGAYRQVLNDIEELERTGVIDD